MSTAERQDGSHYRRWKERDREVKRQQRRSGQDIGPPPDIADPVRRKSADRDFQLFCELYLAETFSLAWSKDHYRVMSIVESAVLHGGLFAFAMPRGSGKTSLCEAACLWAMLYGHRRFVCLVGASEQHALELLASLKSYLDSSDEIGEDFPEVCHPIRALEGIANRAHGQHICGEATRIEWGAKSLVLPTVENSQSSGVTVKVAGITGRIRGMKHTPPGQPPQRPDLVIIDDPQTEESAASPRQCDTREGVIKKAILGLAGPGKSIAGIMPCTIIERGDLADRLLQKDKHPEWRGERSQLVYRWPDRTDLWKEYLSIREDELRNGGDGSRCTQFYAEHRGEMDAGAEIAWPERKTANELSALQHAWNLRQMVKEPAFQSEYQNSPLPTEVHSGTLDRDMLNERINGIAKGEIPLDCSKLTVGIDVQKNALFWVATAWTDDFTGYVTDYGVYPEQQGSRVSYGELRLTIAKRHPFQAFEAALYAALTSSIDLLCDRTWTRQDGADQSIARILIDANWGDSTDLVYRLCREHSQAARLVPSHGRGIKAGDKPMGAYQRRKGDRTGQQWRISTNETRKQRFVMFDSNWWKSCVSERWKTGYPASGSLTVFRSTAEQHKSFLDNMVAEYAVETEGRGRKVHEWKIRPERPDNHWWDALVLSAVAASMEGCSPPGSEPVKAKAKGRRYSGVE